MIMTIDESGEWIDGSTMNDEDLSKRIIYIAIDQGFEPSPYTDDDVYEVSEEAIDWLNENSPLEGYIWGINAEWCAFGLWKDD